MLVPLGVGQEQALAASFVYTLLAVVPMMLAGAVALLLGGRRPTLRAAHGASPPNTRG